MTIDVVQGFCHHVITCGQICIAALQTNIKTSDILIHESYGDPSHITSGAAEESFDHRRREIEQQFPNCQATLSLTRSTDTDLGFATFRYLTLAHGEFRRPVAFVRFSSFVAPEQVAVSETGRLASGDLIIRVLGDYGVDRNKLRAVLKNSGSESNGILCVEGEARTVPVGVYVLDTNNRELAKALEWPAAVEIRDGQMTQVSLPVKRELVPLLVMVEVPATLIGQYVSLSIGSSHQTAKKGRTRSGNWLTWVLPGTHELTVETMGCGATTTVVEVRGGMASHVRVKLALDR